MKTRITRALMAVLMAVMACNALGAEVRITFMNSKGEIQAQLEEAAALFEKENPGIKVELLAAPVGQSAWEKVMALYAAGNAPTLFMDKITSILKVKDKLADLSGEKWAKEIIPTPAMELATPGGKTMAFPATIEGYGILYNRRLLAKAGVDPKAIRTVKDFEAALGKVKAAGIGPAVLAKDDWSVGGHFLYTGYSQSKNQAGWDRMQADLKAGKLDLENNATFNGLLDTFDLLRQYNINSKDPLAPSYDTVNAQFASGEAAFYFQGNWVWPLLTKLTGEDQFGFIPVPIGNDPTAYGNSGIPLSITKFIALDASQNSVEQQAAAKRFLDWLVFSPTGQKVLVEKCSIIPAFKNIALTPKDPLSQSIMKDYIAQGKTIFWPQTPSDHWAKLGVPMQKYLAGAIKRGELLRQIEEYWKNVK